MHIFYREVFLIIRLVDSDLSRHREYIVFHIVNGDDRPSGHLYRYRTEKNRYTALFLLDASKQASIFVVIIIIARFELSVIVGNSSILFAKHNAVCHYD